MVWQWPDLSNNPCAFYDELSRITDVFYLIKNPGAFAGAIDYPLSVSAVRSAGQMATATAAKPDTGGCRHHAALALWGYPAIQPTGTLS